MAGALRFERRISVLETDVLPVKTTRLKKVGVSDGNRTRNIRFGRPAIASRRSSFAHLKKGICIGKDLNLHSAGSATVLQTASLYRQATDAQKTEPSDIADGFYVKI